MYGNFILRITKTGNVLSGELFSDEDHKYTCPPIAFNFKKGDTTSLHDEKDILPTFSVTAAEPALVDTPTEPSLVQKEFKRRTKTYLQELEIIEPVIRVELYDNGEIDYDSVTLFMNDKMVLPKSMLSHKAITLTLPLDTTLEFNELSMFANNVGLIPPNTAAMIIYDGKVRHEIIIISDMDKTGTIKLKRKKKED
jgi:hypothetical protein